MRTLAIFHVDLDGVSCAVLAQYVGYKTLGVDSFFFVDYSERDNLSFFKSLVEPYDRILITDFSPLPEQLNEMLSLGKIVYIWDHHSSSEPIKEIKHKNYKIWHDLEKAGTLLFWEYLKDEFKFLLSEIKVIDYWVSLVSCYDLYKLKDSKWIEAQNCNRVLYGVMNYNKSQYDKYVRFINAILAKFNMHEELSKREVPWYWSRDELQIIERTIKKENQLLEEAKKMLKIRTDSKGNKFGLFHARSKISITCSNVLADENIDIKYLLCINTYDNEKNGILGWMKISARSRNEQEFDCTTLLGFNGHKCAAAWESGQEFSTKLWLGEINNLDYKLTEEIVNG
jgi:oligoribonuclease NrnB/cAMP/cGMP phosphodiesterase (DHH superfamily)